MPDSPIAVMIVIPSGVTLHTVVIGSASRTYAPEVSRAIAEASAVVSVLGIDIRSRGCGFRRAFVSVRDTGFRSIHIFIGLHGTTWICIVSIRLIFFCCQ